jgi:hypothetical protein
VRLGNMLMLYYSPMSKHGMMNKTGFALSQFRNKERELMSSSDGGESKLTCAYDGMFLDCSDMNCR